MSIRTATGSIENLFYQITRRRWLEADAEGLMDHGLLRGSKRLSEMIGEWVKLDRRAALAWAGKIKDPEDLGRLASPLYLQLAREAPLEALGEVEGLMRRSASESWGLDGDSRGDCEARARTPCAPRLSDGPARWPRWRISFWRLPR